MHVAVPPTTNNLNGIVATTNGKWLIAVQSSTASLLRIDPDTGVANTIELTGGDDVMNGDGLLLEGQTLYVVHNFLNRVRVIHLSADFTKSSVSARKRPQATGGAAWRRP